MTLTVTPREVMQLAWSLARAERAFSFVQDWTPGPTYGRQRRASLVEKRALFANALRRAWTQVKSLVARRRAAVAAETRTPAAIRAELEALENRDTLGPEGRARISELLAALPYAEEKAAQNDAKRELIEAEGGRIVTVTFTKADGLERVMKIQPSALRSRVKGEAASPSAQQAAATRKARHPHLFNAWDVEKGGPRSINLGTISRIASRGTVRTYA
ncbi:hypothetical protein SAMN05444417_3301 [Wenxinia saemankumensis]|uniref:Uncharacterized protein n=2 Tax=Wenxinia saemankumensis TaxID=1447782 RepID=A0A1M6HQU2_9RHOB|nr:hypothetical protein SAMN05444417_3301 [Wenxinia saemankumensis]